jgi:hypothetical protein
MPDYKVKDKRSGKEYTIPWDKPTPPSEDDARKYIYEQERPKSVVEKSWDWANKPLTDAPSEVAKKYSDYIAPRTTPLRRRVRT